MLYDFGLIADLSKSEEGFDGAVKKITLMMTTPDDKFESETIQVLTMFKRVLARLHPKKTKECSKDGRRLLQLEIVSY